MEQERQFRLRQSTALGPLEFGQEFAAGHKVPEERYDTAAAAAAALVPVGQIVGQPAVQDCRAVAVAHQGGRHRRAPVLHTAAGVAGTRRRAQVRRPGAYTAREVLQALHPVPVPRE